MRQGFILQEALLNRPGTGGEVDGRSPRHRRAARTGLGAVNAVPAVQSAGPTLIPAIADAVAAARDAGSRAIILRSGLRHVCAGADVAQFDARIEQAGCSRSEIGGVEFLKLLESLPIPIVASVHGACLGGGFELALACDYIVAARSAKIGSVEAALGPHPLLGGIQRPPDDTNDVWSHKWTKAI
jgi:enoyl-CoA hydratase/carnithine racemase